MGEPAERRLTEDQPIVNSNLEPTLAPTAKRQIDEDRRPRPRDFCRQTDGLVEIVSGEAVLDRDPVRRVEHPPSLAELV